MTGLFVRAAVAAGALLLAGCVSPASIEPIEGRTFIIEDRAREAVLGAAAAAVDRFGTVTSTDAVRGEIRGYGGAVLPENAISVFVTRLYPGEDVFTIGVATVRAGPVRFDGDFQLTLIRDIRSRLGICPVDPAGDYDACPPEG